MDKRFLHWCRCCETRKESDPFLARWGLYFSPFRNSSYLRLYRCVVSCAATCNALSLWSERAQKRMVLLCSRVLSPCDTSLCGCPNMSEDRLAQDGCRWIQVETSQLGALSFQKQTTFLHSEPPLYFLFVCLFACGVHTRGGPLGFLKGVSFTWIASSQKRWLVLSCWSVMKRSWRCLSQWIMDGDMVCVVINNDTCAHGADLGGGCFNARHAAHVLFLGLRCAPFSVKEKTTMRRQKWESPGSMEHARIARTCPLSSSTLARRGTREQDHTNRR